MTSSATTVSTRTHLGAAAAGGVMVMGLIPLTAVVGEWWLLGATFATLLATAGLVVLGLFGLLAQTGESAAKARAATKRRAPAGTRAERTRSPRRALLRSA